MWTRWSWRAIGGHWETWKQADQNKETAAANNINATSSKHENTSENTNDIPTDNAMDNASRLVKEGEGKTNVSTMQGAMVPEAEVVQ